MECPLFQLLLLFLDLPLYQFQQNVHSVQIHQSPAMADVRKALKIYLLFNLRLKTNKWHQIWNGNRYHVHFRLSWFGFCIPWHLLKNILFGDLSNSFFFLFYYSVFFFLLKYNTAYRYYTLVNSSWIVDFPFSSFFFFLYEKVLC